MKTTIRDQESLSRFINDVEALHDALLHEAVLIHPGYVAETGEMFGDADLPGAVLIFQSQFHEVCAVRIELTGVSIFRIGFKHDFFLEGEIQNQEIILYPSGKENAEYSEIRACGVEYTMLGKEYRGRSYHLTDGV